MPLKLRPTGLGSGIDKDRPDYTVVTGEWEVGRIYETRGGPDNLRWFKGSTEPGRNLSRRLWGLLWDQRRRASKRLRSLAHTG